MHKKIFEGGKCVYECPPLEKSVKFQESESDKFWDEYKRLVKPHIYKVNLSDGLYELKQSLLQKSKKQ